MARDTNKGSIAMRTKSIARRIRGLEKAAAGKKRNTSDTPSSRTLRRGRISGKR